MTKYPLEWGWDQPGTSKTSTSSEWEPKLTLVGGHDGDVNVAAAWDLRCDGLRGGGGCSPGQGDYGATAMYIFDQGKLCAKRAVKYVGAQGFPDAQQTEMLRPYLLPGR